MKKLFISLVGLFVFTSCSEILFPGGSRITDRFPGIPEEMFYQTVGSCEAGDLSFRTLIGAPAILWDVSSTQSEADILTGQFNIFLNKDQTFTVKYREFNFTNEVYIKTFKSTYEFDSFSREIYFKNLGVGAIYKIRHRYLLKLVLTHNINSVLLTGQTVDIWLVTTSMGLDTDRTQYCNY